MEPDNVDIETKRKFEFFNEWKDWENSFQLFTVAYETEIFCYVNALSIIVFNFEFRFYFGKRSR